MSHRAPPGPTRIPRLGRTGPQRVRGGAVDGDDAAAVAAAEAAAEAAAAAAADAPEKEESDAPDEESVEAEAGPVHRRASGGGGSGGGGVEGTEQQGHGGSGAATKPSPRQLGPPPSQLCLRAVSRLPL